MIYESATWADSARTTVIGIDANGNIETVPSDHTLFRQPDDGPGGFVAAGGVIEGYVPPPVVEKPKRISKNAIWERATNAEALTMRQMLNAQPIRVQEIYDGATHINTDHELFTLLTDAFMQAFGATRASQLLRPDNG